MEDYLAIAKEQFLNLKEEVLDIDRHALGSEDEMNYENNGVKFSIEVSGFWEKTIYFDYVVRDEFGNELETGDYFFN